MKKYIVSICLGMFLFASCSNWLDVKPKTTVEEEEVFSRELGFKEALTGAYIKMASTDLYARNLSYGFLDILGQRYQINAVANYENPLWSTFPSTYTESYTEAIWSKMYNVIANLNNLLYYCDKNRDVFTTEHYYEIIKGEALGLRAFLHFDLLRLFGPVYKTNPEGLSICYNKKFSYQGSNILPASEVIDNILDDLKKAEELLVNDPVITEGPRNTTASDGNNDLRLRTYRLNYYAVQALMARVYLYAGRNEDALIMARKLVEIQPKWYPFVSYNAIMESSNKKKDRVFSTEVLFGLENKQRGDIFTDYFTPELDNGILAPTNTSLLNIFLSENTSDWRFTPFWIKPDNGKYSFRCFHKYEATEETDPFYSYLVPMIRISEMFYIVAETTSDEAEARACLNQIRRNRGLIAFEDTEIIDVQQVLKEEYMKEFFGEGQLFFYYKRNALQHIPDGGTVNSIKNISLDSYVFPLPDSETSQRAE